MEEKVPFAVQAAKASWAAPLLAIAIGFFARTVSSDPETGRSIMLVVGLISLVLVLAGLVLGVVAMFGIRKHGIKGILFPSIIGIALCSLWLYLLYAAIQAARQAAERAEQRTAVQTSLPREAVNH
jgi:hypothetical protein